ncbi:hypothetical protein A4X09_0g4938 [Tilletia walkeri]|uniref:Cytochrome c oxidase subunit 8, mitochondrial n=1 Tax=Tilletia walkeri TaxID=117179 RepID=A0A8X7N6P9_9BASI|nr:hypothetical protein A4X09_0g4938 [Tilletia walkeri]
MLLPFALTVFASSDPALNLTWSFSTGQCLPFPTGPKYKVPIAVGLTSFLVGGFSLPFVAAWFQMAKASS